MENSRNGGGPADDEKQDQWDDPERWRLAVPPKPVIPDEQRQELARQWLNHVGRSPSDHAIKIAARHVMLYHPLSPKGQLANELLAAGVSPTRRRIESEYRAWRDRTIEKHREAGRRLLRYPEVPEQVCTLISDTRAAQGHSPTVLEVAIALGLPSGDASLVVLQAVEAVGLVTMDGTERGLKLTAAGRALVSGSEDQ